MKIIPFLPEHFPLIKKYIENGNPVILPTESSYGFSGDIRITRAVTRVEKIKQRDGKAFLCLVSSYDDFKKYCKQESIDRISSSLKNEIEDSPTSLLLEKNNIFPSSFFPSFDKIGIRKTLYKPLQGFLTYYGHALFSTSANISGKLPLYNEKEIIETFQGFRDILFVSAGDLEKNPPSKIIDVENSHHIIVRK